nr:amidohydrolase family protein [Pigmentibacter ruber]
MQATKIISKFCYLIISLIFIFPIFPHNRYILNNALIITSENNFIPFLGYIEINNDIIENVQQGLYKNETQNINIINCNQKYIVPGFIDSHTHTESIPGMTSQQKLNKLNKDIVKNYYAQLPKSYLYFGYTTILDLSLGNKKEVEEFNSNIFHPQLLISGGPIAEKGGYPLHYLKSDHSFHSIDSNAKNFKTQINTAINNIINNNGVILKLYHEKGFEKNESLPNLSEKSFIYSIDQAHKNKIPVIIHANSLEAYHETIELNHDGYAHGIWRWGNLNYNPKELPPEVKNILNKIITYKIAYQPTTQVMHGILSLYDHNFLEQEDVRKIIPKKLVDWLKNEKNQIVANEIKSGISKEQALEVFNKGQQTLNYLAKRNAFLLFGSDTPSAAIHTNLPGYNGYLEMLNWSKAGVTNSQILKAATIDNAKFLNLDAKIGSIAKNKTANLILLDKNPLDKIEHVNSIQEIILNGKIIARDELISNF